MNDHSIDAPLPGRFGAPHFFLTNDIGSRLTYLSDSVEDVLGFKSKDVIGRNYSDFFVHDHDLNADAAERHFERFQSDENQVVTRAVIDADGNEKVLNVQSYGQLGRNGEVIRSHACVKDVTRPYQRYRMLRDRLRQLDELRTSLTERECEVLNLVVAGNLNKQIARQLQVSTRTVEIARSQTIEKLGVAHVAQAIAMESESRVLRGVVSSMEKDFCSRPILRKTAASVPC